MDKKLIVSSSPHIGARTKTRNIMLDVIIALIPALIASVIIFGPRTLVVTCATVAACVLAEYICRKVMKRDNTVGDLSAIVTGMLLSFNLPSGIPIWIAVLGGVIAIVVVKQMFGGLGQNFVNPALAARIILMTSFPTAMTTWPAPMASGADAVTTATPLAMIAAGNGSDVPGYLDLFLSCDPQGDFTAYPGNLYCCGGCIFGHFRTGPADSDFNRRTVFRCCFYGDRLCDEPADK